jgi:hypothetical protein
MPKSFAKIMADFPVIDAETTPASGILGTSLVEAMRWRTEVI